MGRYKVVHIDGDPGADWTMEREVLAAVDADLVVGGCQDDDQVAAVAADADIVLNTMYWMDRALFERLPRCRMVLRGGVGYDNLDMEAATERGVLVCNVPDYGINEVANHAFALLLALNRKLFVLDHGARTGTPRPDRALLAHTGRVSGQTLGLVAFGRIARAVARRAQGFDLQVIAHDPYVDPAEAAALGVELVGLDALMARSDYLSVHAPLSAATRGLIGADELALAKPSAYLVVTSRGGVVSESALHDALVAGRLAGAGIDVWEQEPVTPAHPLLALDNVIATNHWAWFSELSVPELRRRVPEAAADYLRGVEPRSVVNPSVLPQHHLAPRPPEGGAAA